MCVNWVSGKDEHQGQRAARSNAFQVLKQSQIQEYRRKKGKVILLVFTFCKCCKASLVLMKKLAQHDEKKVTSLTHC